MDILELSKRVDEIEAKYDLKSISDLLRDEFAITPTKELQEVLEQLERDERDLKIGVIGRVKAGKSSLLNGLIFEGESVLPKAATPMTAALTVLEFSKSDEVVVEFFSEDDLRDLKREHSEYIFKFEEILEEKKKELKEKAIKRGKGVDESEIEERAKRVAKKELDKNSRLSSSFELYEKIKSCSDKPKEKSLVVSKDRLEEFVGANGKFMPFTKSVTIKLNDERLKGIEIIDTPGVNDPIVSREQKTKELLKFCDVVFVVSPSAQFLSNEDIDLLDRVSQKEGVNEIVVVASKIDTQLFGNEKDDNGAILSKVLDSIVSKLTNQAKGLFEKNEYLKFIESLKDVETIVYTSGMCYSLYKKFENQDSWDEGERHLFNLLKSNYSAFFEDKEVAKQNLLMISNIEVLKDKLEQKRLKKEEIFLQKRDEFANKKLKVLKEFIEALKIELQKRKQRLENGDIEELKEEFKKLEKIKAECSVALKNSYEMMIDLLKVEFSSTVLEAINPHFKETSKDIRESEDTASESYVREYEVEKERGGFFGGIIDWAIGKKKEIKTETITETYTTVKAGFVRSSIEDLVNSVEDDASSVATTYMMEWKRKLKKEIVSTFRDVAGDENVDMLLMSRIINQIVTKIKFPQIEYEGLPDALKRSGTLKGVDAERFLSEAMEFTNSLQSKVKQDLRKYLEELLFDLKKIDISSMLFEKYDEQIALIKKDYENRELTLARYEMILDDLKGLL